VVAAAKSTLPQPPSRPTWVSIPAEQALIPLRFGTHDTLSQADGLYAELFRLQARYFV
jgi:hypothetical protein